VAVIAREVLDYYFQLQKQHRRPGDGDDAVEMRLDFLLKI
jgi:hypothetical protein